MPIQILVADDHPLFREAIVHLLTRTVPDADVKQVASFAELTGALALGVQPSLVLLDLKLNDTQGIEGMLSLKKQYPSLPVLVISAYDEPEVIRKAAQYGASGFVPKSLDMDAMARVIGEVLDGEVWFPEEVDLAGGSANSNAGFEALTPAQLKVLTLLRNGKPSKEMAALMSVSEATIKAHLTEIFRKLKVRNRTQAVVVANELDLPSLELP